MNLNERACRVLVELADDIGLEYSSHNTGYGKAFVYDFGVESDYSIEDGLTIARACMGCLSNIELVDDLIRVEVSDKPDVATLSCQMIGWCLDLNGGFALGSGPAKLLAFKPDLVVEKIGFLEKNTRACLILESDVLPSALLCERILMDLDADELFIASFKSKSHVGLINIMARIIEVGLYRLFNLGFDVKKIISAVGECVIPLLSDDIMFEANNTLIYDGLVWLELSGWPAGLEDKVVSSYSKLYGQGFKQVYDKAGGDFNLIDPDFFAPAVLEVVDKSDGKHYRAGKSGGVLDG